MSLFIGGLAFADPSLVEEAKLGTLTGSLLAALLGYILLRRAPPASAQLREEAVLNEEIEQNGDVARC